MHGVEKDRKICIEFDAVVIIFACCSFSTAIKGGTISTILTFINNTYLHLTTMQTRLGTRSILRTVLDSIDNNHQQKKSSCRTQNNLMLSLLYLSGVGKLQFRTQYSVDEYRYHRNLRH